MGTAPRARRMASAPALLITAIIPWLFCSASGSASARTFSTIDSLRPAICQVTAAAHSPPTIEMMIEASQCRPKGVNG
ncbi:hypothetical protein FF19_13960 [Klebsiella michiganensis]|nr:hypothetical protein FF19_13960 [Klebsiella michiganensis]